jgi:hypothetical protein
LNDILTELSKPVWWVSVVVAGIVINLLSAYLKSLADKALNGTSSWLGRRSTARQLAWQARVNRVRLDEEAKHEALASEFRLRLQSIHFLLLAMFVMLLAISPTVTGTSVPRLFFVFMFLFSTSMFFMSFLSFLDGAKTARVLRQASNKDNFSIKTKV